MGASGRPAMTLGRHSQPGQVPGCRSAPAVVTVRNDVKGRAGEAQTSNPAVVWLRPADVARMQRAFEAVARRRGAAASATRARRATR